MRGQGFRYAQTPFAVVATSATAGSSGSTSRASVNLPDPYVQCVTAPHQCTPR